MVQGQKGGTHVYKNLSIKDTCINLQKIMLAILAQV